MSGPTRITKSIESSDPDGFVLGTPTGLTHSIEESDPDEFRVSGHTIYETSTIETSDPDEFGLLGPTLETRATETSDSDEMVMEPTNQQSIHLLWKRQMKISFC